MKENQPQKTIRYFFILLILLSCKLSIFAQNETSSFLNQNKLDVNQSSNLINDDVINNYQIVLVGETHGFKENYDVETKLLKEYKQKTNFTYILAEMGLMDSKELNHIISKKDTLALWQFVDRRKRSPAWCKEKYQFYKYIIDLNGASDHPVLFLGSDITINLKLTLENIQQILSKKKITNTKLDSLAKKPRVDSCLTSHLATLLRKADDLNLDKEDDFLYKYNLNNILNYSKANVPNRWNAVRDSCIADNFKKLEDHYQLQDEKMFGIWGSEHVFQSQSENTKWFATYLNHKQGKRVFSYRIFYFDSEGMIPAHWLPGLLKIFRSKRKLYYNTKLLNDDKWTTGTKLAIEDLKEVTPKRSIQLFYLDQPASPFNEQPYLVINSKTDWHTTEYFQAAIAIRNGTPTIPFGKNKKDK